MMKINKWTALIPGMLILCVMLTGCMNNVERMTPNTPNPTEKSMVPGLDFGTGTTPETNATSMPPIFDWMTQGTDVEGKINMLSEIQSSRVIVNGNTALVGVTFADEYKGEMTKRIHDMIAGEVQAADQNIQSVAVTAEEEDVRKINELADRIAAGTPVQELESEIDSIARNLTTVQ